MREIGIDVLHLHPYNSLMNAVSSVGVCSAIQYRVYLGALLEGDRESCSGIVKSLLSSGVSIPRIYEELICRSLYEVGERWAAGEVSVAREHLASALTESLLSEVYPRVFARPARGRRAVVTSLLNEHHQIGGKMVADVFELHGWRGDYLGANTPLEDFLEFVELRQPDVIAFSVALEANLEVLDEALVRVRHAFPSIPVLTGGYAFRATGGTHEVRGDALVLAGLDELEEWIRNAA